MTHVQFVRNKDQPIFNLEAKYFLQLAKIFFECAICRVRQKKKEKDISNCIY